MVDDVNPALLMTLDYGSSVIFLILLWVVQGLHHQPYDPTQPHTINP